MPYRAFVVARANALGEELGFEFAGESFRCRPSPTLGDTFDLMDAPEPAPETLAQAARAIARFVRRLLADDTERARWDDLLRRTGNEGLPALIDLGTWLAEQVAAIPPKPPASSRGGRRPTGKSSKRATAGART